MRQQYPRQQDITMRTPNRKFTPNPNTIEVIRGLCIERAKLQEEIRQLSAAVLIYKELARRSGASAGL
jgi:hypothetical protein